MQRKGPAIALSLHRNTAHGIGYRNWVEGQTKKQQIIFSSRLLEDISVALSLDPPLARPNFILGPWKDQFIVMWLPCSLSFLKLIV